MQINHDLYQAIKIKKIKQKKLYIILELCVI